MVLQDVGNNNAIIVAHPDDETLWAGGLPIRFKDKKWTVICCSVPVADPERAHKFVNVCEFLGVDWMKNDRLESDFDVPHVDLSPFDCIFTHNANGEYGNRHHIRVHDWVCEKAKGVVYTFLGSEYILRLTPEERNHKLAALSEYNHTSPLDNEPKFLALLHRYFAGKDFGVEAYDRI